jgi:DNA-binding winged helix-turn-helix (wHTH) protein
MTNVQDLPGLVVISTTDQGDNDTVMALIHAIRHAPSSIHVIVARSAAPSWVTAGLAYFEVTDFCKLSAFEISHLMDEKKGASTLKASKSFKPEDSQIESQKNFSIGDIKYDRGSGRICVLEQPADFLSPKEGRILEILLENANQCVSRTHIVQFVWPGISVSQRTLDTHISRLRKKLEGSIECYIESTYGKGYSLMTETR